MRIARLAIRSALHAGRDPQCRPVPLRSRQQASQTFGRVRPPTDPLRSGRSTLPATPNRIEDENSAYGEQYDGVRRTGGSATSDIPAAGVFGRTRTAGSATICSRSSPKPRSPSTHRSSPASPRSRSGSCDISRPAPLAELKRVRPPRSSLELSPPNSELDQQAPSSRTVSCGSQHIFGRRGDATFESRMNTLHREANGANPAERSRIYQRSMPLIQRYLASGDYSRPAHRAALRTLSTSYSTLADELPPPFPALCSFFSDNAASWPHDDLDACLHAALISSSWSRRRTERAKDAAFELNKLLRTRMDTRPDAALMDRTAEGLRKSIMDYRAASAAADRQATALFRRLVEGRHPRICLLTPQSRSLLSNAGHAGDADTIQEWAKLSATSDVSAASALLGEALAAASLCETESRLPNTENLPERVLKEAALEVAKGGGELLTDSARASTYRGRAAVCSGVDRHGIRRSLRVRQGSKRAATTSTSIADLGEAFRVALRLAIGEESAGKRPAGDSTGLLRQASEVFAGLAMQQTLEVYSHRHIECGTHETVNLREQLAAFATSTITGSQLPDVYQESVITLLHLERCTGETFDYARGLYLDAIQLASLSPLYIPFAPFASLSRSALRMSENDTIPPSHRRALVDQALVLIDSAWANIALLTEPETFPHGLCRDLGAALVRWGRPDAAMRLVCEFALDLTSKSSVRDYVRKLWIHETLVGAMGGHLDDFYRDQWTPARCRRLVVALRTLKMVGLAPALIFLDWARAVRCSEAFPHLPAAERQVILDSRDDLLPRQYLPGDITHKYARKQADDRAGVDAAILEAMSDYLARRLEQNTFGRAALSVPTEAVAVADGMIAAKESTPSSHDAPSNLAEDPAHADSRAAPPSVDRSPATSLPRARPQATERMLEAARSQRSTRRRAERRRQAREREAAANKVEDDTTAARSRPERTSHATASARAPSTLAKVPAPPGQARWRLELARRELPEAERKRLEQAKARMRNIARRERRERARARAMEAHEASIAGVPSGSREVASLH